MTTNTKSIADILKKYPEYKNVLFSKGFLITDNENINEDVYPFFGNWSKTVSDRFHIYVHPDYTVHIYKHTDGKTFFLAGHAYNPFTLEINEEKILKQIAESKNYYDAVDELTGIFVMGYYDVDALHFITDPAGMQSAYYGIINSNIYVTSHPQLVADLCDLPISDIAKEITSYKWYGRVMGEYLPADMSTYEQIKRIVPNIEFTYSENTIRHRRFYPLKNLKMCTTPEEYNKNIKSAADIMHNNMICISKKWNKPAISLTGGIDSNTTFAAANGLYDKFTTFSYISAEKEIRDADAAKKISEHFSIPYTLYHIPDSDEDIKNIDILKKIIEHNNSYAHKSKSNEIRKRIYLHDNCDIDVEVKSWVSETIRAYWYKHYGRKKMPRLSPKLFRNLYKIFITDRKLAHKIDKIFKEYIEKFEYQNVPSQYLPADLHYNEVTWGSWGGLVISEMKYCFDITIAYNNRRFLDLLLAVPLDKRINDEHHMDMKKYLNKDLFDMGIRVKNMHETNFRAFALNVIFTINMFLPF